MVDGVEVKLYRLTIWSAALLCGFFWPGAVLSQEEPITQSSMEQAFPDRTQTERGTVRCLEADYEETNKQLEDKAFENLPETDRAWLTEDAVYIITPEERCAFLKLDYDDEREQFIEQFWLRRSSNPDLLDNDSKEEHYRRIVFANEKFGTETPGWKTDRGRVYVMFGPPDKIESHASGEPTGRPPEEGPETVQYSWERWHYKYIEGAGRDIDLEFVDPSGSGDYRLTLSLEEHDFLFSPSSHVWTDWKDNEQIWVAPSSERLPDVLVGPLPGPGVRLKDLEAMVVSHIIRDQVYFSHRVEYARATHASTIARIFVDISADELSSSNGQARFEVFGRITKPSGWVMDTFERSSSLTAQLGQADPNLEMNIPLAPGSYRLDIVVKNSASGEAGVIYTTIDVPKYEELGIGKSSVSRWSAAEGLPGTPGTEQCLLPHFAGVK
jgi:GWxTD domain-containing protein